MLGGVKVAALQAGDFIDGENMLDLVIRVLATDAGVDIITNAGHTRYKHTDKVKAYRSMRDELTGDYGLRKIMKKD